MISKGCWVHYFSEKERKLKPNRCDAKFAQKLERPEPKKYIYMYQVGSILFFIGRAEREKGTPKATFQKYATFKFELFILLHLYERY